jgi:Mrp family chromosome partitioning ATPase/capsular polysaccharide biosynthesis protein
MQPADILTTLRRRWPIVAICFVLGLVIAFPAASGAAPATGSFVSSSSVVLRADGAVPLGTVEAVTAIDVPERVAEELAVPGGATEVSQSVTVEPDSEGGVISFTAVAADAEAAAKLADSFARNTLAAVEDQQIRSRDQLAERLAGDLDRLREELASAEDDLSENPGDTLLQARRDGLKDRQASILTRLRESLAVIPGQDVSILRPATAGQPAEDAAAAVTPLRQFALFALLGGAVGVLAALGAERFDPRPHRRDELEAAFRMRTIATIPYPRPRGRSARLTGELARPTEPGALAAFRTLRTALLVTPPYPLLKPDGAPTSPAPPLPTRHRVVLVASVRDSLDSTVVSAGLAAALAESGTRVLAIDGDHLHGRLTAMLGLGPGPGLVDLLERTTLRAGELANTVQLSAGSPPVAAIPCGTTHDYPGASPDRVNGVLDPAREFADVVVVDGAPILDAVQSLDLLPVVDGVLLVASPGEVLREEAAQVAEIFDNLGAKVFGLVLVEPTRRKLRLRAAAQPDGPTAAASHASDGEASLRRTASLASPRS